MKLTRGFTLTEIIVGIVVVILMVMTIYSIFIMSQKVKKTSEDKAEIVQNERAILDRLSRELRQANSIISPLPSDAIIFEDGHGNLDNIPLQYIRYHLVNTDLYREVSYYYFSSDPLVHVYYNELDELNNPPVHQIIEDRLVAEFVNNLNFSGISSNGSIIISITFSKNGQLITLTSDVNSRNLN